MKYFVAFSLYSGYLFAFPTIPGIASWDDLYKCFRSIISYKLPVYREHYHYLHVEKGKEMHLVIVGDRMDESTRDSLSPHKVRGIYEISPDGKDITFVPIADVGTQLQANEDPYESKVARLYSFIQWKHPKLGERYAFIRASDMPQKEEIMLEAATPSQYAFAFPTPVGDAAVLLKKKGVPAGEKKAYTTINPDDILRLNSWDSGVRETLLKVITDGIPTVPDHFSKWGYLPEKDMVDHQKALAICGKLPNEKIRSAIKVAEAELKKRVRPADPTGGPNLAGPVPQPIPQAPQREKDNDRQDPPIPRPPKDDQPNPFPLPKGEGEASDSPLHSQPN